MADTTRFQKDTFYNLSDKNSLRNPSNKSIIGIVETNGLPMGEGDKKKGNIPKLAGLYRYMCRVNHSCIANVHHQYNPNIGKHQIYAIRNIKPDQEITTNYFHIVGKTFNARQKLQKEKWNFYCCCQRCNAEKFDMNVREENDSRENLLSKLDHEIQFFTAFEPRKALIKCEERLMILYEYFSLYDPIELLRTYFDAFQISISLEDCRYLVPGYITRAFVLSVIIRGVSAPETMKLRSFCIEPLSVLPSKNRLSLSMFERKALNISPNKLGILETSGISMFERYIC